VEEKGVFVLRSGEPINPKVVDEMLESIGQVAIAAYA
jgi:hypothetical protein